MGDRVWKTLRYLRYGPLAIMILMGSQMILSGDSRIPVWIMWVTIISILAVSIAVSVFKSTETKSVIGLKE